MRIQTRRTTRILWLLLLSILVMKTESAEWQQQAAKILANQSVGHDGVGSALALWDSTESSNAAWLAIGAPHHTTDDQAGAGAAYVFAVQSDLQWTQIATLTAPLVASQALFGTALSRSETGLLAIGSPGEVNGGSVYLFQQNRMDNPDAWTLQQTLTSSSPEGQFGKTVEWLYDSTLWVGSPLAGLAVSNRTTLNTGLVHVYQQIPASTTSTNVVKLIQVLEPPDAYRQSHMQFGHAIAGTSHGNDNYVAISAPADPGPSDLQNAGTVSLYQKLTNTEGFYFSFVAQLHAPEAGAQDLLGSSVAVEYPLVVAGAIGHNAGQGAVHTWQWTEGDTPVHVDTLLVGAAPNDGLGQSVLLTSNENINLWVGALKGDGHTEDEGTVQQATWTNGNSWTSISSNATRLLEPVGSRGTVEFGATLASAGPWLAVGATHDSGNGAFRSGLAYVFLRNDDDDDTPDAVPTNTPVAVPVVPTNTPVAVPVVPTNTPVAVPVVPTRIPTWVAVTAAPNGLATSPPTPGTTNPPVIVTTNPPVPPPQAFTPDETDARSGAGRFGYALAGMVLAVAAFVGGRHVGRIQGFQEPGPHEMAQSALAFGQQEEEETAPSRRRRLELGQHESSESNSSVDMTEDGKYEI